MSKYLTREQVVADFKLNILPPLRKILGKDANNFNEIKSYFDMSLEGLLNDKSISESQKSKWKLKEEDII